MKKILIPLVVAGVLMSAIVQFAPAKMYDLTIDATRKAAGLEVHKVQHEGHTYTYLDSGVDSEKPTLLMIHGFTADKDNWARMAIFLQHDYRVVSLDLLGHGDSDKPTDVSYGIEAQTARVHGIANALSLAPFHIVGNSMGGMIAGYYGAQYPEDVLSVSMLDNAGINSPTPSDMLVMLNEGKPHPLIITEDMDADEYFEFVFHHVPYMPTSVKKNYIQENAPKAALYEKIFQDFHQFDLTPHLPNIQDPVQVVWGKEDRVLHVSSVDVMTPMLKNPNVVIMEGVGHLPMMEVPNQMAEVYDTFLQQL